MRSGSHSLLHTLLGFLALTGTTGCEELGPDARGEVNTTALQRVGVERECLPFFDVAKVQSKGARTLGFSLRDGTQWVNRLVPLNADVNAETNGEGGDSVCHLEQEGLSVMFDSSPEEVCADEVVLVGSRSNQLQRYLGSCRLGRFERI